MAEPIQLPEPLRQIFDANLGYYKALGRVTADYMKALGQVWTDAAAAVVPGLSGGAGAAAHAPATSQPGQAAATPTAPAAPALVLEAEAGQSAQAVFMVDNGLPRAVAATVETSEFSSADGRRASPPLRIQPATVTLEPGGRTLVQITAVVDDTLQPGVSYRGQVSVPGLSDRPVPVILRRKVPAAPVRAPAGTEAAASRAQGKRGPGKSARGKRANGSPPRRRKGG